MLSKQTWKRVCMFGFVIVLGATLMACGKAKDNKVKPDLKPEVQQEINFKEKPIVIDYSASPEEILASYTEKGMKLFKANFPDTLTMNYALKNIGKEVPDISGKTMDGKDFKLSDLKGKKVLISFGKTTCSVCKEMSPILKGIADSNPELVILHVFPVDNNQDIQAYYKGLNLDTPANILSLENNEGLKELAVSQYQIEQVPTYVFVDESGRISYTYIGNKDKILFQDMIDTAFGDEKLYDNVRTVTVRVDQDGNEIEEEQLIEENKINEDGIDHHGSTEPSNGSETQS